MKKSISIILAIALLFVAFPIASAQGETGSSMSMLHTSGSRIVNEAGEQITLRGTNLGGWLG